MGTIPSQNIEQIAAANDIVEVIGSYFPLKRAGTNFKALCPFHQEKTPSFTVSPQRQTFHCFGCGVGGSVFRFVMDYEHLDFPAAVRKLAARAGIPVIEERGATGDDDRQHETRRALLQLHAEAAEWFHENLVKEKIGKPARDYLKNRGIDRRIATDWQIGFAPESWDAFLTWALDRGYRRPQILQSGLIKPRDENRPDGEAYDRFRGRIMFPIHNDVGEVIAFSGRVLEKEAEGAKYLNSPETPLFRKGRVLFGLHKTKRALIEARSAIICEGQLDLITVFEAGVKNVVAPQGTAFTEDQARVLKRFVDEIVLCFDSDSAGFKAAERSLGALLKSDSAWFNAFAYHLRIRLAEMPPGEDPDSLIRRQGVAAFTDLVANAPDFFDYWLSRAAAQTDLGSVNERVDLARALAGTVSHIHDKLMRSQVAQKIATRLAIPMAEFDQLVVKPKSTGAESETTAVANIRHEIGMLCLLALRHPEAREFLQAQGWREMLAQTPDAEILGRILEVDLRPDDPASINAFMSGMTTGDEALVSSWLLQKMPSNGLEVAKGWWNGLRRAVLRRQLQIAEGRMKLPRLTTGEAVNLQKQILDLTEQLRELPEFSSARVLDT